MQISNLPSYKFPLAWAQNAGGAYIATIPVNSQLPGQPGVPSLNDGATPANMTPIPSGGIPMSGKYFNGILNQITQWQQWQQAGGPIPYDGTFSGLIGGYPSSAVVGSATNAGTMWYCNTDNNTTNPDASGAGWVNMKNVWYPYIAASGGPNVWTATMAPAPISYFDGLCVRVKFSATNTAAAAATINFNSLGAAAIYNALGTAAIAADNLPLYAVLQYSTSVGGFVCTNAPGNAAYGGATVTNPQTTNITLTNVSSLLQTIKPTSYGLTITFPDATTMPTLGATAFSVINRGLYPVALLDNSGTCFGWSTSGTVTNCALESAANAAGVWCPSSGNQLADAVGLYISQSSGMPGFSQGAAGSASICQLSVTNGFVANAGNFYGWSENETGKAFGAASTLSVFATAHFVSLVPLTSTTALVIYRAVTTGYLSAVVATLNTSTLALTFGSPQTITSSDTPNIGISGGNRGLASVVLSSTLALVAYATTAGAIKLLTVSVSGTSCTPNSIQTTSVTTTGTGGLTLLALSATLGQIIYYDSSAGVSAMRIPISSTTPTAGTPLAIKAGYSMWNCWVVNTTQVAVVYNNYGTSSFQAQTNGNVINDSGTAIALGIEQLTLVNNRITALAATNNGAVIPASGNRAYSIFTTNSLPVISIPISFSVSAGIVTVGKNQPATIFPGAGYPVANIELSQYSGSPSFQIPVASGALTNAQLLITTGYIVAEH